MPLQSGLEDPRSASVKSSSTTATGAARPGFYGAAADRPPPPQQHADATNLQYAAADGSTASGASPQPTVPEFGRRYDTEYIETPTEQQDARYARPAPLGQQQQQPRHEPEPSELVQPRTGRPGDFMARVAGMMTTDATELPPRRPLPLASEARGRETAPRPLNDSAAVASRGGGGADRTPARFRSGSVASLSQGSEATGLPEGIAGDGDANPLFARGRFDSYRSNPTPVVDPRRIKPYRSERQLVKRKNLNGDPMSEPRKRGSRDRSYSPATRQRLETLPVTESNPFRQQSFNGFVLAPNYAPPLECVEVLDAAARHGSNTAASRNHRSENLAEPAFHGRLAAGGREPSPGANGREPVYPASDAIDALMSGTWFYKWARRKDKIHRRYFWLHGNGTLFWAKAPHANLVVSSSLPVTEIVDLEAKSEVDANTGRTFYVMVIWTVNRTVQIGTELHDKFDMWFEALSNLSRGAREHNQAYYSRHSTMRPVKHDNNVRAAGPSD